ncbi:MAG: FHA domain-containing protein [Oscillospiraceae bacterium]|nr:FHA domain-containing protein [Oscillospiraceae bacterium]
MAIKKCPNGHYFDDLKYPACPHCEGNAAATPVSKGEDPKTVAMREPQISGTKPQERSRRITTGAKDDVTVGIFTSKMQADPVVGWLVGQSGSERGRDYRLHTGRNFIGRSIKMDVALADDEEISRENHCSILYDPANAAYYIAQGEGTNTYLNGTLLTGASKLAEGDTIRLGNAEMVFIPYCKEDRKWL